ncbi:MAG: hypothetical protein AB7P33_08900 [Dehalococcoidia bacterium]
MTGRIILVGAGEMLAAMSGQHRQALARLQGPPRPVFLDTTAGYETNVDSISAKAVEYYQHHLQTKLEVAHFRHSERESPSEVAASIEKIRRANLIFAGPGSPTFAIKHWRGSPIWEAVCAQFEAGADLFFASAASITMGRYALPVYEIYKAGEDPHWKDGLDMLGRFGVNVAVVPHYNDNSGGDNYDTRFCYMGASRFDRLQALLPADTAILGLDAYTALCFDPATGLATVSGQGGITLIGDGAQRRFESGDALPFDAFHSTSRAVVQTYSPETAISGYEGGDNEESAADFVEGLSSISREDKIELLGRIKRLADMKSDDDGADAGPIVDLVLELREALRQAKRYDLADKARNVLSEQGYEIADSPQGSTWSRP